MNSLVSWMKEGRNGWRGSKPTLAVSIRSQENCTSTSVVDRLRTFLLHLLLASLLSSCSGISLATLTDPETSQQHSSTYTTVNPGQTASQTFIARRPRLNSITLWVKPVSHAGQVVVALSHNPGDDHTIYTQSIPYASLLHGVLKINLPSQPDPAGQCYILLLRPEGSGMQVGGRSEDAYPNGQAYLEQAALQADFAFTTTYDYDTNALFADLGNSLPRLWLVLPLLVLLYLPGWLLMQVSGVARRLDWGERVGLALGLSLALVPLAMLWSTNLGLRWGRTGLLAAAGFLVATVLWRISPLSFMKSPDDSEKRQDSPRPSSKLPVILTLVFLLTLGVRLVMARDLSAPAWVDSVHHATISRLILEKGGFPSSYAPYIDIEAVEYHAGFHSLLAAFQWLSGLDSPEAMLLLGQVLNALIPFVVYLLTVNLTRQPAAGVAAAILAGLFTPMPAYYTSWGRYTQLAGLLILPAGFSLARWGVQGHREATSGGSMKRKYCIATVGTTAIAWAGLFLVHYRITGFLALLLVAYFLSQGSRHRVETLHLVKRVLLFTSAAVLLTLLFSLPWSWQAITRVFAPKATLIAGSTAQAFDGFYWEYLAAAWGIPAMGLAGLGLLISLVRMPRLAVTMIVWSGLLLLAANLGALHLPGGWFVNTVAVAITLFLPTAVLGGVALGQTYLFLQHLVPPRMKKLLNVGLVVLGLVVCWMAARMLLPILRPSTALFREADRAAIAWIDKHIPPGETVLINPTYWGYGTYAGADGGYWITPLTGRLTMPPPVLYALAGAEEKQHVRTLCEAVIQNAGDAEALVEILHTQGIRYVFIGQRGGVLSPRLLQESTSFKVLYAFQGAWAFEVQKAPP